VSSGRVIYLAAGERREVEVPCGRTLMQAAVAAGIDGIVAECGGAAMCATCHIYVEPEHLSCLPLMAADEDEMLDCAAAPRTDRSRLACQLAMTPELDGIAVRIPESGP
jgi:ferredoxin, 2Fe-2S